LQCFVEKILEKLQEVFIELVHNSAMKDYLKSSPIDVLWVVSSRNGTSNNGKNGKVGKNGTFLILGFENGVWVGVCLISVCHFYPLFHLCHYYLCNVHLKSFWV